MLIAGIFIITAFVIFAFFSFIILLPGWLLYNAGIKNIYNNMMKQGNAPYDENITMIDVSATDNNTNFTNKGKNFFKSVIKKIRNFLNKYAD